MKMTEYILETFEYNDSTNKKLLEKIKLLTDKTDSIKLFSHLINCQYKWMARITNDPKQSELSWWDPLYTVEEMEAEWSKSLQPWLVYLFSHDDETIAKEVQFTGFDGCIYAASPKDIMLQLNYHSIHHRAQIQTIIRQQGIEADFVDYIGTRYRKLT
jgi:uncharacterized damage-inducible protein DinB